MSLGSLVLVKEGKEARCSLLAWEGQPESERWNGRPLTSDGETVEENDTNDEREDEEEELTMVVDSDCERKMSALSLSSAEASSPSFHTHGQ